VELADNEIFWSRGIVTFAVLGDAEEGTLRDGAAEA